MINKTFPPYVWCWGFSPKLKPLGTDLPTVCWGQWNCPSYPHVAMTNDGQQINSQTTLQNHLSPASLRAASPFLSLWMAIPRLTMSWKDENISWPQGREAGVTLTFQAANSRVTKSQISGLLRCQRMSIKIKNLQSSRQRGKAWEEQFHHDFSYGWENAIASSNWC